MELKTFIEEALVNIVEAVEDAQKQLLYGEIVPDRDAKTGDADIEFEITVKSEEKEGQKAKLFVVTGSTSVKPPGAPPPPAGAPPPSAAPPPPPPAGKLKFKIPVRLPKKRGCFLIRRIEYFLIKRRKKKEINALVKKQTKPKDVPGGKEEQKTETPKQ